MLIFARMKKLNILSIFLVLLASCAAPLSYVEPKTIILSHEEVMSTDFPLKEQVFGKFGSPNSKETYNKMENWYYKLGEITSSRSNGLSMGTGKLSADPYKPSLISNNIQSTIVNTQTISKETYVKFWFRNDTVIKWETYGVNFQREIPNPNFNEILYNEAIKKREESKESSSVVIMIISLLTMAFLISRFQF